MMSALFARRRAGRTGVGFLLLTIALLIVPLALAPAAHAQQAIDLTLDRMVELGLRDSYRARQLLMDIERTREVLRAEQAALKSRVDLSVSTPDFQRISDYKWNSTLQQNELVYTNTRRWEASLAVRQPVILFGFPTNGILSLNNRVYRYSQLGTNSDDIQYYNRYFIAYQQPLFQPNRMKNELEGARLDLERSGLEFQDNVVTTINDLSNDYFELFETAYEGVITAEAMAHLEEATTAARELVATQTTRAIELDQIRVALANAREEFQQATSGYRLQTANIKQRLRVANADSLVLNPVLKVEPVQISVERAVELAKTLAPRLRRLAITRREQEIRLDDTRGRDAFRVNVNMTYGRETQDPQFGNLWTEPRNSYTIRVDGFIPIWDWGQRRHRIRADQYNLQRTDLQVEQAQTEIETSVRNEIRNLEEYQQRALNMQENLEFARQNTVTTLERYRAGDVTLVDVLQTIDRQSATARNFVDVYLGYRRALIRIERLTFYDFQRGAPLLDRFDFESMRGSLNN